VPNLFIKAKRLGIPETGIRHQDSSEITAMSMPLIAVIAFAATGMAATVAFVGDRSLPREESSALAASTAPVERSSRRGNKVAEEAVQTNLIATSNDSMRPGMRTPPNSVAGAPTEASGDWTRRGARNTQTSAVLQ
jgi:hypothetical protein